MRWKNPNTPEPEEGTVRQERRFAWIPVTIGDESRWFEMVTIEWRYEGLYTGRVMDRPVERGELRWEMKRFID